jgi:ABC-type nitrate/sulfonate/bicarbonate transport system substrate-binding protein
MSASPATVRVIAFPGAPNLPTFAALEQGFFGHHGIAVELALTPSSVEQAKRMAAGAFDVAFTAFDNVVAYSEGMGAAGAGIDPHYVVVLGATQLELALIAAPDIKTVAELKGRSIALDALSTGFAFVLYEMLARAGVDRTDVTFAAVGATPQRWQSVKAGEHAATLTIEPFTSIARRAGYNVLDLSTRLFDSYQGGVIAARRPFAAEHPDVLRAFLRGYREGLAWTLEPANRAAAEALLLARMPEIKPEAAAAVMQSLLSPRSGLTPDGGILHDGMKRVLELRSRYGGGKPLTDPDRYLDLGYSR